MELNIAKLLNQLEIYVNRNIDKLDDSDYNMLSAVLVVLETLRVEEEEKKWKK